MSKELYDNIVLPSMHELRQSSFFDENDSLIKNESKDKILLQTFPKNIVLYNAIPYHRFLAHSQNENTKLNLIKNFKIDNDLFTENPIFIRGYNWLHG